MESFVCLIQWFVLLHYICIIVTSQNNGLLNSRKDYSPKHKLTLLEKLFSNAEVGVGISIVSKSIYPMSSAEGNRHRNQTNDTTNYTQHSNALHIRKLASIIVGVGFVPFIFFMIIFCRVIPGKCAQVLEE